MIDTLAAFVALTKENVLNTITGGHFWFATTTPVAMEEMDYQALAILESLLHDSGHNLAAVTCQIANMKVWLPLLRVAPSMKTMETSLFGQYDTNMDMMAFWKYSEAIIGREIEPGEMYSLVSLVDWWYSTINRWTVGSALYQVDMEKIAADEEE
jgi:hypothetical protein